MLEKRPGPVALCLLMVATLAAAPATGAAESWRTFTDVQGRTVEARVITVLDDEARVVLRKSNREVGLGFDRLCEEDRDYLRSWTPGQGADGAAVAGDDTVLNKRLYPRTRDEIRATVDEILMREAAPGVGDELRKAVNELNVYRYLCGVPYDVEADPAIADRAQQAAKACMDHGGLSHDLGHYTDKCNLHSGSGMFESVGGYIGDGGDNNRERRGHRRWCLNPPMARTGFGDAGNFSAMWAMDSGGKGLRDSWAYPGKGFYPRKRLLGNGWSLYLTERAPAKDDLTVEVFELGAPPQRPFGWTTDIPGARLDVDYVSTYLNAINFEPKGIKERGIYWVRIRGGGLREQYLVELF